METRIQPRKIVLQLHQGDVTVQDQFLHMSIEEIINHYSLQYPELINHKIHYEYDEANQCQTIKVEATRGEKG